MSERALDPANYSLSEQQIRDVYAYCKHCESVGNGGGFSSGGARGSFILESRYRRFREGIFFYSSGWGWRLRKKPHWETVFAQRFPNTYALIKEQQ